MKKEARNFQWTLEEREKSFEERKYFIDIINKGLRKNVNKNEIKNNLRSCSFFIFNLDKKSFLV